eukprot:TRINITY_DN13447_c0_g1_i1.p1 TRINITY_DN13447_c0_g1~~TRINITY_DN13447_c0_g1_i1.p1  ORF type:complete len:110 (+),score=20.60 TRINITY_DN13447_c0_g1_i1:45-374(+)
MGSAAGKKAEDAASDDRKKVAFRKCLQDECVPQVQQVMQLRAANNATMKFGMVTTGNPATRQGHNSDLHHRMSDVENGLLACEQQCARRHWSDALTKPWYVAEDRHRFH